MATELLTIEETRKVARLAGLPITDAQAAQFRTELSAVLGYMAQIQELDTDGVPETTQVTGLENIYRDDVAAPERSFTQAEALQNAKRVHKGYFVVDALITK
jgi:aspartyl-tRNA(Asn)/glutamyl-tRNA(Gln) amidotransferase subunit C